MATHFGGTGVTPEDDPKSQNIDNVSGDAYQDEDVIKQLCCETALLR